MKLLVTDLDNTLYDWVTYFARSFDAMAAVLERQLEIPREQLFREFRVIHQRFGESERAYSALELPSVAERYPDCSREKRASLLAPAFDAFSAERKRSLTLYPGVQDTLEAFARTGIRIVGHTEASEHNAVGRLESLGIASYFSELFALESPTQTHPNPFYVAPPSKVRERVHRVPRSERKPNPELLRHICQRESTAPSETVYIGDSITRDVSMANASGVFSVWARYGTTFAPQAWEVLTRITHWTEEDVLRERALKVQFAAEKPRYIADSFSDLMRLPR